MQFENRIKYFSTLTKSFTNDDVAPPVAYNQFLPIAQVMDSLKIVFERNSIVRTEG